MGHMRLGIIGGMGPKATSVFYDRLIEATVAHKDQDHIDMIILNHATLPDRTTAILQGEEERFLEAIRKDFYLMEQAGVANIAIPCNTSHYFYNELQAMTSIPIINMIDETMQAIYKRHGEGTKVGLLATRGTIRSGIYKKVCDKYQMQLYTPDEVLQEKVMNIIYTNIKGDLQIDASEFEEIILDLIRNHSCDCVIIGCTELSIIPLRDEIAQYCFDAMDILVERSIELSGKQSKRKARMVSVSES